MKHTVSVSKLSKELAFLYQVAQTVYSLELNELLKNIVAIAARVTKSDSCLVYVIDPDKQALILRASKNRHPDLLEKISLKVGEGITGWVAKEKKTVALSRGAHKDPRFKFFRNLPEDRFEAFLSVPIISKRGIVGVINVQHKKQHTHTEMEINLLSAIGKLVGGSVENALLIQETYELKEALEMRKRIEKAKGVLMKKKNLTESDAYKLLQKEAMNSRKSLREIADAVILAETLQLEP